MNDATSQTCRSASAHRVDLLFWGTILLIILISIPLRRDATPDVSWLITLCERILDGKRAYVDFIATTPPVAMLLYMPGVVLSRLTGLTPETLTFAFAYASALVSIALSARILPDHVADRGSSRWLVLLPAAVILFVLPSDAFAQREYFAAAFALPMVCVFVRHAHEGAWPPLPERVVAAVLAGLTIAIKPPLFALPGIVMAAYYWWRTRSLSFLVSSGLVAAGVVSLVLTAASLALFPGYLEESMTVLRELYVPTRSHPLACLNDKVCIGVLSCFLLALILRAGQKPPIAAAFSLMTASGFLVAYFIQAKFFPYQSFPNALFAGIAAWILIYGRLRSLVPATSATFVAAFGVYALAILGISALFVVGFNDGRPTMSDLSWAARLHRPRALAISPYEMTSFPLARRIGAVWVDKVDCQWMALYTRFALQFDGLTDAERATFLRYHKQDLQWTLHQIEDKAPDIIFQNAWQGDSWLMSELLALKPNFLEGYDIIAEEGGIRVLGRRIADKQ